MRFLETAAEEGMIVQSRCFFVTLGTYSASHTSTIKTLFCSCLPHDVRVLPLAPIFHKQRRKVVHNERISACTPSR
jgi:hypothetical protein